MGSKSKEDKQKTAGSKKQRIIFGTNAVVLMAVVVVVAVLLNLIVEQIPMNLDLTEEKLFTLTETTEEVLEGLEEEISIYALYDRTTGESDSNTSDVIKVLDLYDRYDNVEVSYVDLDKKPSFLLNTVGESNYRDYAAGDYIVKCGDRTRRIDADDMYAVYEQSYMYFYTQNIITGLQVETKVTGAIVRVTSDVPVIYWSVGFGESELGDAYYETFVESIEDSNYELKTLDLKSEEIPEDASAMIFMAPTEDLNDTSVDKLLKWFNNGGNAFFFMDVKTSDGAYIYNDFENFNLVLEHFSLKINNDIVEEGEEYKYPDDSDSIFYSNTLTAGSLENEQSMKVYIHNTRSIDILDTSDDFQEPEAIIATSNDAFAVSIEDESVSYGKKIVAASSKYTGGAATSRVVLFGSSANLQLAAVGYFGTAGIEVVKGSLEWMNIETVQNPADDIEVKSYNRVVSSIVDVTEKETKYIAIIVAIVIPVIILLVGLVVWLRRRHL